MIMKILKTTVDDMGNEPLIRSCLVLFSAVSLHSDGAGVMYHSGIRPLLLEAKTKFADDDYIPFDAGQACALVCKIALRNQQLSALTVLAAARV